MSRGHCASLIAPTLLHPHIGALGLMCIGLNGSVCRLVGRDRSAGYRTQAA